MSTGVGASVLERRPRGLRRPRATHCRKPSRPSAREQLASKQMLLYLSGTTSRKLAPGDKPCRHRVGREFIPTARKKVLGKLFERRSALELHERHHFFPPKWVRYPDHGCVDDAAAP